MKSNNRSGYQIGILSHLDLTQWSCTCWTSLVCIHVTCSPTSNLLHIYCGFPWELVTLWMICFILEAEHAFLRLKKYRYNINQCFIKETKHLTCKVHYINRKANLPPVNESFSIMYIFIVIWCKSFTFQKCLLTKTPY